LPGRSHRRRRADSKRSASGGSLTGGARMKTAVASVVAALAASACCIGPVVFSLMGAGALSAASTKMEPYRPWFLAAAAVMLGGAFYTAYRPLAVDVCDAERCEPRSRTIARLLVWIAAIVAALLIAFPYYIGFFM
jgi:mercuric ion transport protein